MRSVLDRPLNLKKYRRGDVVEHYRDGGVLVVVERVWRSECLRLLDACSGEEVIHHPRWLDQITNPLLVLAAQAVKRKG